MVGFFVLFCFVLVAFLSDIIVSRRLCRRVIVGVVINIVIFINIILSFRGWHENRFRMTSDDKKKQMFISITSNLILISTVSTLFSVTAACVLSDPCLKEKYWKIRVFVNTSIMFKSVDNRFTTSYLQP